MLAGLRSDAAYAIAELEQSDANRLRALAGVGRDTSVLRERLQVVTDDRICVQAGAQLEHLNKGDRFAVIKVGRVYWVTSKSAGGTVALDDHFAVVMRMVSLD